MEKFLKRKKQPLYQWVSLILSVVSTCLLIASAVVSKQSTNNCIIGICCCVFAQIIKSATFLLETSLFRTIRTKTTLYIGLEGLWGFLLIFAFIIPFFNISNTPEGHGLHENLLDTVKMLGNNLLWVIPEVFVFAFSIPYAMAHGNITSQEHPHRLPFFEACSAFIVWIVEIIIYYSLRNNEYGRMHPKLGEPFKVSSLWTLFGYLAMAFSVIVYSKLLPFKWLYPPTEDEVGIMETQRSEENDVLPENNAINM